MKELSNHDRHEYGAKRYDVVYETDGKLQDTHFWSRDEAHLFAEKAVHDGSSNAVVFEITATKIAQYWTEVET